MNDDGGDDMSGGGVLRGEESERDQTAGQIMMRSEFRLDAAVVAQYYTLCQLQLLDSGGAM